MGRSKDGGLWRTQKKQLDSLKNANNLYFAVVLLSHCSVGFCGIR